MRWSNILCLNVQAWNRVVQATDSLARALRSQAEGLAGPLGKVTSLIQEKQQLRRFFQEAHRELGQELHKVRNSSPIRCSFLTFISSVVQSRGNGYILNNLLVWPLLRHQYVHAVYTTLAIVPLCFD